MGIEITNEVMMRRPRRPGQEWFVLLDLAVEADDTTRGGACRLGYLGRWEVPLEVVRNWLESLCLQDLIKITEDDGVSIAYEVLAIPERDPVAEAKAADAEDCRETALYRWWDGADVPLYIGIAGDLSDRTKSHIKSSSWMEFVARSSVERHPRRSLALAAEEVAIKAEKPVFNRQHNDTPEARQRLVEYLTAADRLDMLTPRLRAALEEDQRSA